MKKYLQRAAHLSLVWLTFFVAQIRAEVFSLNSLFSDHMVLQRNQPIRIFGTGPDRSLNNYKSSVAPTNVEKPR